MRTPATLNLLAMLATLTLACCNAPTTPVDTGVEESPTPLPFPSFVVPEPSYRVFGEPADIFAAGGSELRVTPLNAVGRLRTTTEQGRLYGQAAVFVAVKVAIENVGSVPWDPKLGRWEGNPCFGVAPADEAIDFCPRSIYGGRCDFRYIRDVAWTKSPEFKESLLRPGAKRIGWMTFCVYAREPGQDQLRARDATGSYVFFAALGSEIWQFGLDF